MAKSGMYTVAGLEQKIQSAMDSAQCVVDAFPDASPESLQAELVFSLLLDARRECRALAAMERGEA